MSESQNYYRVLNVPETASEAKIKQAFRALARECHPDLNPNNPEAEVAFKLLQEAYAVLGDRTKRQQYDRLLSYGATDNFRVSAPRASTAQNSQLADYQRIYSQGMQLASQRKYDLADQRFSQAIKLRPESLEAYMGRCQVRYVLGDNRGVLEDSTQIIRLRSQVPQAYYYQGRARHRLNYVENAIEAYSQAISLDHSYASAYYYRGLARADVREKKGAIADLKAASQLYRGSGNQKGAVRAETQLRQLRRQSFNSPLEKVQIVGSVLTEAVFNPIGVTLPMFRALSMGQAASVGLAMALGAIASIVISCSIFWPTLVTLSWYQISLLAAIPFITMALVTNIVLLLGQQTLGNWSGDIFVAGSTFLPAGLGSLLTSFYPILGSRYLWALGIAVFCLMIMIFYSGLTRVSRVSEGQATWIVLTSVLLSAAGVDWFYQFLMTI